METSISRALNLVKNRLQQLRRQCKWQRRTSEILSDLTRSKAAVRAFWSHTDTHSMHHHHHHHHHHHAVRYKYSCSLEPITVFASLGVTMPVIYITDEMLVTVKEMCKPQASSVLLIPASTLKMEAPTHYTEQQPRRPRIPGPLFTSDAICLLHSSVGN
jgi:hypothetical protein